MADIIHMNSEQEEQGNAKNAVLWKDRKHFMWFPFSFTKYEVRNNRLYTQRGLLSTTYDEVLLYRILDITRRFSGPGPFWYVPRQTGTATYFWRILNSPEW